MKKPFYKYNNKVHIFEPIMILWEEKKKIILIILISVLISIGHTYYKKPKNDLFKYSLIIKESDNIEFTKFIPLIYSIDNIKVSTNNIFDKNIFDKNILDKNKNELNKIFFNMFTKELMDYRELVSVLNNNQEVKKNISNLPINERQKKLFNYVKSLTFKKLSKENFSYVLNFNWHNDKEGEDILKQTLELTLINLKKSVFKNIEQFIETEKEIILINDQIKLNNLMKHSRIARNLNIPNMSTMIKSENSINSGLTRNFLTRNFLRSADNYYLMGFKAIDEEIKLIKNRKYENLNNIYEKINYLKNSHFNWINYDIFLLEKKLMYNFPDNQFWISSVLRGFLFGIVYVYFYNAFKSYKTVRKKVN